MPELAGDRLAREIRHWWIRAATLLAVVASAAVVPIAETAAYRIDPTKSRVTIHVGKTGAFSFMAGHAHEVSGPIQTGSIDIDLETPSRSHVRIEIASSDLVVSAAGEPAGDAPKVQEAMQGNKVLDVHRYPKITYESTAVTLKNRRANALELSVAGQLTIRDVTQPITVPVGVEMSGRGLIATGRFEIKQSAFGITPISVGGVVSVKDALGLDFSIAATEDVHAQLSCDQCPRRQAHLSPHLGQSPPDESLQGLRYR